MDERERSDQPRPTIVDSNEDGFVVSGTVDGPAPSPSGKARVCKTLIPGSNPGGALKGSVLQSFFYLRPNSTSTMTRPLFGLVLVLATALLTQSTNAGSSTLSATTAPGESEPW
jgi:hypothetical protein